MEFIQAHWFIFMYNIGLIIAMLYIASKALKGTGQSDGQIMRNILAAIIWPLMAVVNLIATVFGSLQNILNKLITVPKPNSDSPTNKLENTDIISLDEIHGSNRK